MRVKKTTSKSKVHYSIIKDVVIEGKKTTRVFENIGNFDKLQQRAGEQDPLEWLDLYVQELNIQLKEKNLPVIIRKYPNTLISKDVRRSFNIGYLFLKSLYHQLGLQDICNNISDKYQYKFNLNDILSQLIYSQIIFPCSKRKSHSLSQTFLNTTPYALQQSYRALEILAKESNFIQSELYKNSIQYSSRNTGVLYYDCTNYYFEIEESDGFKQYGKSKEHRPNPIVQMGLFLDSNGIPLAFDISAGNTNEQLTLKPLEETIVQDFQLAKFVVCTDAGLSSIANRKFNNTNNRRFITTQSLKKLKKYLRKDVIDLASGWQIYGSNKKYNIQELRTNEELIQKYKDTIFYKERWINENDLEQRLIITYSVKYQEYQRKVRNNQVERANKIIADNPSKIGKAKQNNPERFILQTSAIEADKATTKAIYSINLDKVNEEEQYDGLYAVCTNLEDSVQSIIEVNKRRWEIEESFRIMKTDLKSRPVYLSRDDRIKAHFTICFLALIIIRYLEKRLNERYTVTEIIEVLRNMNVISEPEGYIPSYTRTDLTDDLHEEFNFRTDYEILTHKQIKNIFSTLEK